ncbi:MAG: arginyltransferase [Pirellulaceae bacterium]
MHDLDYLRIVIDETSVCPYLPEQTSRMPLRVPCETVTAVKLDELLEAGYRRSGWFYYRTQCPSCSACEPLRINVDTFRPNRSQSRAKKMGDQCLKVTWREPIVDERRVELFNKHRRARGLDKDNPPADAADYTAFLVHTSCPTVELGLWLGERLLSVAITDVGDRSLSAVYCCFDPEFSKLSLGTYAILTQIEWARARKRKDSQTAWLYLGLYVERNPHLNYKAKFMPHQRLINRHWREFTREATGP